MTIALSVLGILVAAIFVKIKFFPSNYDPRKFHTEFLMEQYYRALIDQIYLHLENKSFNKEKAEKIDTYLKSQRQELGFVIYHVANETYQRVGDKPVEYLKTIPLFVEIAWPAAVHGTMFGSSFKDCYLEMLNTNNLISQMSDDEREKLSKDLGIAG